MARPYSARRHSSASHCHKLAYASARDDSRDTATRYADRLRALVAWNLNSEQGKPKWVRWRTFDRLAEPHDQFVGRSMSGLAERLGILERRVMKSARPRPVGINAWGGATFRWQAGALQPPWRRRLRGSAPH